MSKEVPEGEWVTLFLKMDDQAILEILPSEDPVKEYFIANFSLQSWHSLLDNSNITIGMFNQLKFLMQCIVNNI